VLRQNGLAGREITRVDDISRLSPKLKILIIGLGESKPYKKGGSMKKGRVNVLKEFSDYLPEELQEPDETLRPSVLHEPHKTREPYKPSRIKKPVGPRSRSGDVIVSPTVKFCIQCGKTETRTDESHDKWGKRRRCEACKVDRTRGEIGVRFCMVCGTKFDCPSGRYNSTRALCESHRAETDRRKGIIRG
jgi:hypothetical protein